MTHTNDGIDVLRRPGADGSRHLDPFDDLPLHHDAAVLAAATVPENWAERYYFNVLRPSGEIVAVIGAGIYPGRGIAECYFCRIEGDIQHNVRATQPLGAAADSGSAPFALRCIEPLNAWHATLTAGDARFDGRYTAGTRPYHYSNITIGPDAAGAAADDYQHVVAAGSWQLEALTGGDPALSYRCIRDRTWGRRTRRMRLHNWMVFELDGACITVMHQERADASVLFGEGGISWPDGSMERLQVEHYDFEFDPHTRVARSGYYALAGPETKLRLNYTTVGHGIRLSGAGYDDAQGARRTGLQTDSYDLGNDEEARRTGRGTIDVGALAEISGDLTGTAFGIVESAVARDHVRFGKHIA